MKQPASEGKYTKIFAREVQRHIYERPCFVATQNSRSSNVGRPVMRPSHKTPGCRSYVNQLVWLSSNKPVYPQFHKPQDSESHYTRLLRSTELDDDDYALPTVWYILSNSIPWLPLVYTLLGSQQTALYFFLVVLHLLSVVCMCYKNTSYFYLATYFPFSLLLIGVYLYINRIF